MTRLIWQTNTNIASGADLAALVREAATAALRNYYFQDVANTEPGETEVARVNLVVTQDNFNHAFDKVKPSVSDAQREKYTKTLQRFL